MALSTRSVFEFFSPVCIKALKWLKYDNIPYRTKAVLLAYNVWHHCIRKPLFSSVHTKREFGVFKKSTLGTAFWGPVFLVPEKAAKNTLIRVDGTLNSCSQMLRPYGYAADESTLYGQNISSARASRLFVFCFVFPNFYFFIVNTSSRLSYTCNGHLRFKYFPKSVGPCRS